MKTYLFALFLGLILLFASLVSAQNLPVDTFAVGEIKIGETTFNEVTKKYGEAKRYRISKNEGADEYICYVEQKGKYKQYFVYETGEMGGYTAVTGFRLTSKPHKNCTNVNEDILPTKVSNGISIGQPYNDFLNKFMVSFIKKGNSRLEFENVSQRKATAEELSYLQKTWPNIQESQFDITVNIAAQFHNKRLTDFYISKIESN